MTESKSNNPSVKPVIPSLGASKAVSGLSKLPKLHGPNLMGLKPLSVPGSKLGGIPKPSPVISASHAAPEPEPVDEPVKADEEVPSSEASPSSEATENGFNFGEDASLEASPSSLVSKDWFNFGEDASVEYSAGDNFGWDDIGEAEGGGSTQAVPQPTPEEIAAAIAASEAAKKAQASDANTVQASSEPVPSAASAAEAESVSESEAPSSSTLPQPSIKGDSSIDPNMNEDELQWEDEESNDGEKTQMLEIPMEDDEEEADGEKTQIQMDAFEFDPLSGKIIVEAGKAPQREYIIVRDSTSIGRGPKNEIVIQDISISRHHVKIEKHPAGFKIVDLDSANGTYLNGRRIKSGQLRDADIIEIGNLRFRFEQSGGDPYELWKGEPIVELHPNQSKPRSHAGGAPAPVSAAPASAAAPSAPAAPAETMIERAGGGLAAPSWAPPATISPLTSPYMMSYVGGMQQKAPTPVWAILMISVAVVLCIGSLVFFFVSLGQVRSAEAEYAEQKKNISELTTNLENAISAYGEQRFVEARGSLKLAQQINETLMAASPDDKDNKAQEFINKMTILVDEEYEIYNDILEANKTYQSPSLKESFDDVEKALKEFKEISEDSVCYGIVRTRTIPMIEGAYANKISTDVRRLSKAGKFDEARELVTRLIKLEPSSVDLDSKVKDLNQVIETNEKRKL